MSDFKPGDVVGHKVMGGQFVIMSFHSGNPGEHPVPDFDIRSPEGKVIAVFQSELQEWNSTVTIS